MFIFVILYDFFLLEKGLMMNQKLISVGELAEALNVPKSWVYSRSRKSGPKSMPKLKVGKYVRFRIDDVIEWIEEQGVREKES